MNWKLTRLADFLSERNGRIKHAHANRLGLQRIRKIDFSGNLHLDTATDTKTDMIRVRRGDLVISGINAAKGAIAIYEDDEDVLATIHYSAYQFNSDLISIEFLKWFFRSSKFADLLREQVSGGIKTELKPKHILPLQVKLPTLPEQRIIANRLNRFLSEQLKLEEEIAHQESLLAKLKQAILQEAIQGKLTADWRTANPDVEPASNLLHRIKIEKTRLIAKKKLRKEKALPEITAEEISFKSPKSWQWRRLAETSLNRDGERKPISKTQRKQRKKVYPYYGASGEIDKIDGFTHDGHFLLIGEDGSNLRLRSTPIAFEAKGKIWVNNHAHVIQFTESILQDFVKHYLNGVDISEFVTGGFQPKLSQTSLNHIPIPLPPLAEQAVIVERIDALMTTCRDLEMEIEQSRTHADHLLRATLKEAFSSA